MYTDDTILTFGKYKFIKLCRVPADYLLAFHKQYNPNHKKANKELFEYIENNLEKIKARQEGKIISPPLEIGYKTTGRFVQLVCKDSNKIIFPSEKDAKHEIRRIQNLEQENKKPVRAYECEKCGGWHLTSISFERWEKLKNI